MTRKIILLSEEVINQIAAGEVVEHPAAAIKELIENAIDANAQEIRLEILGGGHQLIRIEDDGLGMSREDAIASLQRHATSKIQETADLLTLQTMGFRGEALAAIASVSEFEMETSDGMETTRIKAEGGRILNVQPAARNRGTTIEIRSLFYNVPARQKFQKSAASSVAQIRKVVQIMALAHPELNFSLASQGTVIFDKKAEIDWKRRAREILGNLPHEISHQLGGYFLHGLLGSPEEAKPNRNGQYLFLNRRPIFSPLVARAVKNGFATRLSEANHPSFLLFLKLPPEEFDINVHPQKKDVRFQFESKVYALIEQAVSAAFSSPVDFQTPVQFAFPTSPSFEPAPLPWILREETQQSFALFVKMNKVIALIGSFAIVESEGYNLLDLRRAEARILFETGSRKQIQQLIVPLEIELSMDERNKGEQWIEEFHDLGIESRLLGDKMWIIDSMPEGMEPNEFQEFFLSWKAERTQAAAISRFCKMRKKTYSIEEAEWIQKRLAECDDPSYDPLGRLICRKIEEKDLMLLMS